MRLSNFRVPGAITGLALLAGIAVAPAIAVKTVSPNVGTNLSSPEIDPTLVAQASRCPSNYVCLFRDGGAQGPYFRFQIGSADFTTLRCSDCRGGNFNDDMTSYVNNTNSDFCWYFDANYRGETRVMRQLPGRIINVTASENDKASSLKKCG